MCSKEDLVSIAVATYNGERFLQSQLESIIKQTYHNLEIIIVDDASHDNTFEIIKEYASRDERIKYFKNETNCGVIKTFERAIKLTQGRFIALADQDDIWHRYKIYDLVQFMKNHPKVLLCFHNAELIDENDNLISPDFWRYAGIRIREGHIFDHTCLSQTIIERNCISGCMTLFQCQLKSYIFPFPAEIAIHDWWLGFVASFWGSIQSIPRPLIQYRQHSANLCGAKLTPELWTKKPLVTRYYQNALQYLAMYNYIAHINSAEILSSKRNQLNHLKKQLFRYYITYKKRYKMLEKKKRSSRLGLLLESPFGLWSIKKLTRDFEIALKLRNIYY